jgi:chromosome segregation ATPase
MLNNEAESKVIAALQVEIQSAKNQLSSVYQELERVQKQKMGREMELSRLEAAISEKTDIEVTLAESIDHKTKQLAEISDTLVSTGATLSETEVEVRLQGVELTRVLDEASEAHKVMEREASELADLRQTVIAEQDKLFSDKQAFQQKVEKLSKALSEL